MSTSYSSSSNTPNGDNRAKKLLPWAIAAIVALAGTNIATWVGLSNKKTELSSTQVELKKEEDLNSQLETQYKDAVAQLEEMKGKNTELNALIDKQKAELSTQKSKIAGLINVSKDLNGARAELARMKASVQGYLDQIAGLEQKNKELTENVTTLTTEKTKLQEDFTKEQAAKQEVITQKQAVEQEKAKVEEERAMFAKKTEIGSVVHTTNFAVKGFKVKESGKTKERTHAKNIDRLRWCFDAVENRVTDAGSEVFYIRIIDPTGVSIATSSGGGGVVKLADGREVQYTTQKTLDFKNDGVNMCVDWDAKGNATLQKGKYNIEVYNKGYLAGKSEFDLK
jgi:hypothetical protein